jgi:hypothetical protein
VNSQGLIFYLLVIVIVLLCEPQEQRRRTLGWMLVFSGCGLALYYVGPIVLGLFFAISRPALRHLWWTLAIVILLIYAPVFGRLIWLDARENRAIRAGSKEAFDRRVSEYMGPTFNYSYERAVEATTKIRDGRRK